MVRLFNLLLHVSFIILFLLAFITCPTSSVWELVVRKHHGIGADERHLESYVSITIGEKPKASYQVQKKKTKEKNQGSCTYGEVFETEDANLDEFQETTSMHCGTS